MSFADTLWSNFLSILQIFILGCAGFYVLKRGILGACCLRTVSNLVLEVTMPCFMFTNIVANFPLVRGEGWYLFPVYAVAMILLGAALAAGYVKLDRGIRERGEFASLVAFNNGGFMPIVIIGSLLPAEAAGKVYVYIFLFTLIYPAVMFSLSGRIFSGRGGGRPGWKDVLNSATLSTLLAVAVSMAGLGKYVPEFLFRPLKLIGDATIPLSMIVVGGILMVNFSPKALERAGFVLKAAALKLLALPAVTYAVLLLVDLPRDVEFLLILESLMPPAVTLPLLAGKHDGDYVLVGQALSGITILSFLTVPPALALFHLFPTAG